MSVNVFQWIPLKTKIIHLINSKDVVGLKKILSNDDIAKDEKVDNLLGEKLSCNAEYILYAFDDNGKFVPEAFETDEIMFNSIIYRSSLFDLITTNDPKVYENFTGLEKQFIIFIKNEIKSGREKDIKAIFDNNWINKENLSKYFDGNGFTSEFYFSLVGNSSIQISNLSSEFKSHYTPLELIINEKIFNFSHLISTPYNEEYSETISIIENLLSSIERNELEKFITLQGINRKLTLNEQNIEELYSKLILNSASKRIIEKRYNNLDLKKSLDKYLTDAEIQLFLKDKIEIINLLYGKREKEIKKLLYLSNGNLMIDPLYISNKLANKSKKELFVTLSGIANNVDLNKIDLSEFNINKNVLISLFKVMDSFNFAKKDSIDFLNKILETSNELSQEQLEHLEQILTYICEKIYNTNAVELKYFGGDIVAKLLKISDKVDYKDAIDKIEETFSNNNIPIVGKKFLIYKILNPDLEEIDFQLDYSISPTLKKVSKNRRYNILFSDLFRITLGSNNISMRQYLENLYYGNRLYNAIANEKISLDSLKDEEKEILESFLENLKELYKNTKKGEIESFKSSGELISDLNNLIPLFNPTEDFTLLDRIVRMYGIVAGFNTFNEAYEYINRKVIEATNRGEELSRKPLVLAKGDMVKGIGDTTYLYDILQNGSLCKEFLGPYSGSDSTPLDTDLSMILKQRFNNSKTLSKTIAQGYGPIWFVIKKGKFPINRLKPGDDTGEITRGVECFTTLDEGHMGIRTGFASSDIDYIMIDENEVSKDEVNFIVALNQIYIPVTNKSGEIIFTKEEYDEIVKKMDGLSYYGINDFELSNNLKVPNNYDNKTIIEKSKNKKEHINKFISKIMKDKFNYNFYPKFTHNISVGSVQLIDTGSTGRGTNVGDKTDFDFVMRVDEKADRMEIAKAICEELGINIQEAIEKEMVFKNGNIRLKNIEIPNIDDPIDMDITFLSKSDYVTYTTDMALKDRLDTIKRKYPDKYEDVLDNIIYAKQFLKENEVYKPSHARDSQGGLGGVGIENWILQNGGSFYDACLSFYNAATSYGKLKPFDKFKQIYKIYDFGENFYNGKHDEFVQNNMTEEGYKKMYRTVKLYLINQKNIEEQKIVSNENDSTLGHNQFKI